MLAGGLRLLALLMDGQYLLEVELKGAILHVVANIEGGQRVGDDLVGEAQEGAQQLIVLIVLRLE